MSKVISLTGAQIHALKVILEHHHDQGDVEEFDTEVNAILVKLNKEPKQAKIITDVPAE